MPACTMPPCERVSGRDRAKWLMAGELFDGAFFAGFVIVGFGVGRERIAAHDLGVALFWDCQGCETRKGEVFGGGMLARIISPLCRAS